jgi:hypothetical protein
MKFFFGFPFFYSGDRQLSKVLILKSDKLLFTTLMREVTLAPLEGVQLSPGSNEVEINKLSPDIDEK